MRTSFSHDFLARATPVLIMIFAIAALRSQSFELSLACLALSLLSIYLCIIELIIRREKMLEERTDLIGRSRATRTSRLMSELYLVTNLSDFKYVTMLGIFGVAGLLVGATTLIRALRMAGA